MPDEGRGHRPGSYRRRVCHAPPLRRAPQFRGWGLAMHLADAIVEPAETRRSGRVGREGPLFHGCMHSEAPVAIRLTGVAGGVLSGGWRELLPRLRCEPGWFTATGPPGLSVVARATGPMGCAAATPHGVRSE